MITHFELMDRCAEIGLAGDRAALPELFKLMMHDDWRVRYAASVAAGDLRAPEAIAPLMWVLWREDAAPLYSQPPLPAGGSAGSSGVTTPAFPEGTTPETIEAWRRRGRVKQAACLALGYIGEAAPQALAALQRYAVAPEEDYVVRAAACQALGKINHPSSREVLLRAAKDEEWCTNHEAAKALARLPA